MAWGLVHEIRKILAVFARCHKEGKGHRGTLLVQTRIAVLRQ